MISCDFFGGLGNNLFQLATVYSMHKKYGYELRIPSFTNRGNISIYNQSDKLELSQLFENEFIYDDTISSKYFRYTHNDINPNNTDYTFKEFEAKDNLIYHGYFQSEKYFFGVSIEDEFKLKKTNIEFIKNKYQNIFDKKNISLHYRLGGDRVTSHMQHYHKNVSTDFFNSAIKLIEDYSPEVYNILVFTDNIDLCKKLLSNFPYPLIYIDNSNNNILDFTFMSCCDINIVSNSTFSWWSAYLNKNKNKKVFVTESEWFGPGYKHFNLKDTFPESWIRL